MPRKKDPKGWPQSRREPATTADHIVDYIKEQKGSVPVSRMRQRFRWRRDLSESLQTLIHTGRVRLDTPYVAGKLGRPVSLYVLVK